MHVGTTPHSGGPCVCINAFRDIANKRCNLMKTPLGHGKNCLGHSETVGKYAPPPPPPMAPSDLHVCLKSMLSAQQRVPYHLSLEIFGYPCASNDF